VWEAAYAWEGYARSKGIWKDEGSFMTREELDELKRKLPDKSWPKSTS
jgi:hypothetical protein